MNGMPSARDVHVHVKEDKGSGKGQKTSSGALGSKSSSGLVTVMGFDRNDVLFRSDKVGLVQWRDSGGEIVALLIRIKPDIWGFVHKGEDDFDEMVEKYGNEDRQEGD